MNPKATTAVILSAGFSKRMGDFKPLMTLGRMTVLERTIQLFQSAGIFRIHVVTGHRSADLALRIECWGARNVFNPFYREGMFSSVAAGVSSLDEATQAFFVLPVDIPLVRPATIRDLLDTFQPGTAAICHPTFQGRRGHPPLIGAQHIGSVLSWREQGGLAALLARLERFAVDVPVVDEFIHSDMDTPEDCHRMTRRLQSRKAFSQAECETLMIDRLRVPPAVADHGRAVAETAACIANALNEAGLSLNLRLIRAAALVHDMARGSVDHAGQGANLLRSLDMHKMAEIVENHMEIAWSEGQQIHEAEVVFLADKLVQEDRYVGLGERFRRRMNDFCVDSQAHAGIRRRIGTARKIAEQIEAVTGRTLESLQCQKPAVRSAR